MILQKTVLRALVGAACLAPATGQIVFRESLTDRTVWKHTGGATTVTGSSRFGKVDRLSSAAQFSYVRQAITLQPGSYRARVRFQKTHGLAQDPLRLEVRAAATVLGQSTVAVGKARIGRWEHTPSATFLLTKPTAVIVTLAGGSPFRLDRRWMFDGVELERTHFNGDSALDTLGTSSSGAGDVNGDGFADVVVGAPWDDHSAADSGSARVLSGKDGRVLYVFHGDSAGDGLGWSVSGAGDVNGDGVVDVIVGAPGDDNNVSLSGSARVFSGKDGKALYTLNGDGAGDQFGQSVSGAGDVNGDGFADVVVGARNDDNNAANSGSARVFSGKDGKILYTFNGDRADDGFGTSVSGAGDVNGDGFADVIVGAPGNDSNGRASGSARVFSGKDGTVLHRFSGASTFDELGKSVSSAGDVNRDGFADLFVGAPGYGSTGAGAGFARVFSGQNGKVLFTFHGDHALDAFGWSVSGAGDVNGDGFVDLIVGAVSDDNSGRDSGSARVFSGKSGKVLRTYIGESAFDRFGLSVGGAGDVNGDGLADLVVGANNDDNTGVNSGSVRVILSEVEVYRPGATFQDWIVSDVGDVNRDGHADVIVGDSRNSRARVLSGKDGGTIFTIRGTGGSLFGESVSGAGDVNGDGVPDVIIGARHEGGGRNFGSARVFSVKDASVIHSFKGSDGDQFGWSVSSAGEVNGDGFADVVVGAPYDDNSGANFGSAQVFSGKDGKVLHTFNGDGTNEFFGAAVSGAGDVNGDGFADIIVGAWSDGNNGAQSGSARVFSGKDGKLLYTFNGDSAGDRFGWSVSGAGDVNGDGFADMIVGAPLDDNDGVSSGSVRVFSGKDGTALYTVNGKASDGLGRSVSGVGDVSGDGFADVLVGAPGRTSSSQWVGTAHLLSGRDGAVLRTFNGLAGDGFGTSVSGGGDMNADGIPDLVVGAENKKNARAFLSGRYETPGKYRVYGRPCRDRGGRLPRASLNRVPRVGESVTTILTYHAQTRVLLAYGAQSVDLPLGGGCRLLIAPILGLLPLATSKAPFYTHVLNIPNRPGLIGLQMFSQWALADPKNGVLRTSDAVTSTIGSPFPK